MIDKKKNQRKKNKQDDLFHFFKSAITKPGKFFTAPLTKYVFNYVSIAINIKKICFLHRKNYRNDQRVTILIMTTSVV